MEVNGDPEKAFDKASSFRKPSGRSPAPMAGPIADSSAEQLDESGQKLDRRDILQLPITADILQIRRRNETNGGKSKKLGVTWQNLTVKGISSDALYNENILSQFNPFGKLSKSPPWWKHLLVPELTNILAFDSSMPSRDLMQHTPRVATPT